MDLTPENIVEQQHKSWLQNPTTIQMFLNFEKQKKFILETLAIKATEPETPDSFFRFGIHSIKMINNLVQQTKDTKTFLTVSEKQ